MSQVSSLRSQVSLIALRGYSLNVMVIVIVFLSGLCHCHFLGPIMSPHHSNQMYCSCCHHCHHWERDCCIFSPEVDSTLASNWFLSKHLNVFANFCVLGSGQSCFWPVFCIFRPKIVGTFRSVFTAPKIFQLFSQVFLFYDFEFKAICELKPKGKNLTEVGSMYFYR